MRLPRSKIYRAFPELDDFTDSQCAAYVKSASRAERASWGWMCVLAVLGWFALAGVLMLGSAAWAAVVRTRHVADWVETVMVAASLVFIVGLPTLALVALRDRWLRRAIARHLENSLCPQCRYQLLGLPPIDGLLRCPECGHPHTLDSLGFSQEQWEVMHARVFAG